MKRLLKSKRRLALVGFLMLFLLGFVLLVLPRINGSADCTSVERYDVVRNECYFECDSDQQCEALTKQVNDELNAQFTATATKPASSKPVSSETSKNGKLYTLESTGSETKGSVYTVLPNGLQPKPTPANEQLWQLTNNLIGAANTHKHFVSFEVFNDPKNDTAASVWRSQNPIQWHMNINAAYAGQDKKELIRTIIHEYGHVITLSGNQVGEVHGACPRIQLDEGCGNPNSYINNFYKSFWSSYDFPADQVGSISEDEAADLYASESNSFVSEYASTNITEDLAESFADFVTKAKPSGKAIKDQKVRFFYQYPELVTLREQIRTAAAKEIL